MFDWALNRPPNSNSYEFEQISPPQGSASVIYLWAKIKFECQLTYQASDDHLPATVLTH